jgi:hypothetical protein
MARVQLASPLGCGPFSNGCLAQDGSARNLPQLPSNYDSGQTSNGSSFILASMDKRIGELPDCTDVENKSTKSYTISQEAARSMPLSGCNPTPTPAGHTPRPDCEQQQILGD